LRDPSKLNALDLLARFGLLKMLLDWESSSSDSITLWSDEPILRKGRYQEKYGSKLWQRCGQNEEHAATQRGVSRKIRVKIMAAVW